MQKGPLGPLSSSGVGCSPAGDARDPFPPLEGSKGPVSGPGPVAVSERSVWDVPTGSPVPSLPWPFHLWYLTRDLLLGLRAFLHAGCPLHEG